MCVDGEPGAKERKVMCLLEKMEVLDKLQSGLSIATVRCHYGVNELETISGEVLRSVLHQVQKFLL